MISGIKFLLIKEQLNLESNILFFCLRIFLGLHLLVVGLWHFILIYIIVDIQINGFQINQLKYQFLIFLITFLVYQFYLVFLVAL